MCLRVEVKQDTDNMSTTLSGGGVRQKTWVPSFFIRKLTFMKTKLKVINVSVKSSSKDSG